MEIRKIKKEELHLLQNFLDTKWKKNHSLVKSKELLDFQHLHNNYYNYYACIDDDTIWAILGFIPTTLYDESIINNDCWGAIWKNSEDCPYEGIGIELMETLLANEGKDSFGAIGISTIAKKIYKLFGMKISYLSHYYIANNSISSFNVGQNLIIENTLQFINEDCEIKRIVDLSFVDDTLVSYYPIKSIKYLINRYQNHPIYKYLFYGIYQYGILRSIFVIRRITVENTSILRIVDIYGVLDGLPKLYNHFQALLKDENCEYIDCLNFGIEESVFLELGFTIHDNSSNKIIIPNYFEPFEKKNITIEIAYFAKDRKYVAFKGDSDQDRPNVL